AFGRGTITFLYPSNRKGLAFIRRYEEEQLLCGANRARCVQYVELDLSAFKGMVAVELFGRTPFPPIGDLPYLLTLGPHSFYWFALEPSRGEPARVSAAEEAKPPRIQVSGPWEKVFEGAALGAALPALLRSRRWFGGKALDIKSATVTATVPFEHEAGSACFAFIRVYCLQGTPETYVCPITFASAVTASVVRGNAPQAVLAELEVSGRDGTT